MAETKTKRTMNTRISLKIDTWANWHDTSKGANLVLARGEVAFVQIGSIPPGTTDQVIDTVLFKVGDGTSKFSELQWGSAMAADVYDWAKETEEEFYLRLTGKAKVDCTETFVTTSDFDVAIANITDATKDGTIANRVKKLEDAVDTANLSVASGKTKTVQNAIDKAKADLVGTTELTVSDMGTITSINSDAPNTITGAKQYAIDVVKTLLNAYILDEATGDTTDAIDKLVEIANWIDSDEDGVANILTSIDGKLNTADFNKWLSDTFAGVDAVKHSHSNKSLLDTYTQTEANLADAVANKHSHNNKTVLDGIAATDITNWNGKLDASAFSKWQTDSFNPVATAKHSHSNKDLLDTYDQTNDNIKDAVTKKHSHTNSDVLNGIDANDITNWDGKLDASVFNQWKTASFDPVDTVKHSHTNKALLDTYTQTEANLADAVAKKHSHENAAVLNGLTAAEVTSWNSTVANAFTEEDVFYINCGTSTENAFLISQ